MQAPGDVIELKGLRRGWLEKAWMRWKGLWTACQTIIQRCLPLASTLLCEIWQRRREGAREGEGEKAVMSLSFSAKHFSQERVSHLWIRFHMALQGDCWGCACSWSHSIKSQGQYKKADGIGPQGIISMLNYWEDYCMSCLRCSLPG